MAVESDIKEGDIVASDMKEGDMKEHVVDIDDLADGALPRNGTPTADSAQQEMDEDMAEQVTALTMALGEAERAKFAQTPTVTPQISEESFVKVKDELLGLPAAESKRVPRKFMSRKVNIRAHLERFEKTSAEKNSSRRMCFMNALCLLPTCISLWYASAVFFGAGAQHEAPALLWTPGVGKMDHGVPDASPKPSLCSHGWVEVLCLVNSRLTAYAMYISMCLTFLTKCHATVRYLSRTFIAELLPLQMLHKTHHQQGLLFCILAASHTITHLIRWIIRDEMKYIAHQAGLSGVVAMVVMLMVIISMQCTCVRRCVGYEFRFNVHWLFILLVISLCYHAERTMVITLTASLIWLSDYMYMLIWGTYRLDLVEFTRLEDGGVQMLWLNPPGFEPNSGEFLKVQLPWLQKGGQEWHAFSLYKQEYTKEGLQAVNSTLSLEDSPAMGRVYKPSDAKGGKAIDTATTCLVLIEFQNEFASPGGKLHDGVKKVMKSTNMIANTVELVKVARKSGVKIFHAPIMFAHNSTDNPNKGVGILKDCADQQLFLQGSWNADFIEEMGPAFGDIVVKGKKGLDAFPGTDLEKHLIENGIHTVILGGFLTDCCVESTMRTAYEKGFNTITLTDGTATFTEEAQSAATKGTFLKFSQPMSCKEVSLELNKVHQADLVFSGVKTTKFEEEAQPLVDFIAEAAAHTLGDAGSIDEAVRKGMASEKYATTQIFMQAVGDWTKQLSEEVKGARRHRTCWVRGPYMSPYSIAKDFSQLLLFATGIGITPAFGIMGQYRGASKTKILVWSTRSIHMLKFFAPMLRETQVAYIYYTGKPKLSKMEILEIRRSSQSEGVFIFQKRPSLVNVMSCIVCTFEGVHHFGKDNEKVDIMKVDRHKRASWCGLYCGGSHVIMNELKKAAKDFGMGFDAELFDW